RGAFKRQHLVTNEMQTDDGRRRLRIKEVAPHGFAHVFAQLIYGVGLGKDAVTESACLISALRTVEHFEDNLAAVHVADCIESTDCRLSDASANKARRAPRPRARQ